MGLHTFGPRTKVQHLSILILGRCCFSIEAYAPSCSVAGFLYFAAFSLDVVFRSPRIISPFSFFNKKSNDPPMLFSSSQRANSVARISEFLNRSQFFNASIQSANFHSALISSPFSSFSRVACSSFPRFSHPFSPPR